MLLRFRGELFYWRGPAPWYFVAVPEQPSQQILELSRVLTYGWGMIPVTATIGATTWTTALFRQEDNYVLPVKAMVRRAEGLDEGEPVAVAMTVGEAVS
jgi:hypothetical protein